jgi:hypothetical protein
MPLGHLRVMGFSRSLSHPALSHLGPGAITRYEASAGGLYPPAACPLGPGAFTSYEARCAGGLYPPALCPLGTLEHFRVLGLLLLASVLRHALCPLNHSQHFSAWGRFIWGFPSRIPTYSVIMPTGPSEHRSLKSPSRGPPETPPACLLDPSD